MKRKAALLLITSIAVRVGARVPRGALASTVAETFNAVLDATGGRLANPGDITTGNYGMRKSKFVYRPTSTRSKSAITYKVSSKEDGAFEKLTSYGIYQGLTDPDFQIIGGSNYIKRAVYATFELGGQNATNFDQSVLLGNIASAQAYESYLANSAVINAIASAESDSVFAIETAINLARAVELGLTKRHRSDWFGGYNALFEEAGTNAAGVEFGFDYDPFSDQISRLTGVGDFVLGDSIDVAGQTTIEVAEDDTASQTIDLRSGKLADQTGYTVNGVLRDDVAHSGSGNDFAPRSDAPVTFNAGNLRASTWAIGIYGDGVNDGEAEESFRVTLGDGTGSQLMGSDAVVTIVNNADKAYLMVGKSYAAESDGYLVWRVSLSKALGTGDSVTLDLSLASDRAEAGADYTETLEVSANGTSGWVAATSLTLTSGDWFVRVAVLPDNTLNPTYDPYEFDGEGIIIPGSGNGEAEFDGIEGNQRLTLTASVTAGEAYLQNGDAPVSGIGTIIDGTSADPYVWADDLIVHEGDGVTVFKAVSVARSRADSSTTGVTFSTADNRELEIPVAATVDAGGGDDIVHASDLGDNIFGGDGNDTLYGGRLDDWLLGGGGNDVLDAAAQGANTLGGDGNYLNGGAGDDLIQGREGSDWLEGGDGVDQLSGAGGGDILTGGAGEGDLLYGGDGDDSYLLRLGDGADIADDSGPEVVARSANHNLYLTALSGAGLIQGIEDAYDHAIDYVSNFGTAGYIQARFAGLSDGSIARDWTGYLTPGVSDVGSSGARLGGASLGGGEDSIVLGQGIGIGDVRLVRSESSPGVAGDDLIVQIMGVDANGGAVETGDQMTLTGWFTDPFKRIEWLKFADGNEIRIGDITSFVAGTNGNDTLIGTLGNDFLYGGDGNDQLFLLAGDDIGSGGSGLDYVAGDSGDDLIVGGSDNDALTGGAGVDVLSGDGGNDDIYGGDGNDIISGGRGNDHLVGGGGDDVFKYSRGDGADTIFDDFAGDWETVWDRNGTGNGGFAVGYNVSADGEISKGGEIVRQNIGTTDDPQYQWVGRWEFDSANEVLKRLVVPANSSEVQNSNGVNSYRWDPVTGEYAATTSSLGDLIEFAPGINIQDIVLRETGDDLTLHISRDRGSSGILDTDGDSITLKDWALTVNNIERLAFFSTGELDLTQTNLIGGTDGDDVLAGGANADWITGGTGEDNIDGGAGDDILLGNGGIDIIRGGDGDDVLYGGGGDDILIGGANSVASDSQGDILIGGAGSDWASYEDETADIEVYLGAPRLNTGVAFGDNYVSIENLRGGQGNDKLVGDGFENILEGGSGDDVLQGGAGDDVYIWNGSGDGADQIEEGLVSLVEAMDADGNLLPGFTANVVQLGNGEPLGNGQNDWSAIVTIKNSGGTNVYFYNFDNATSPVSNSPANWPVGGWLSGYAQTGNGQQVALNGLDANTDAGIDTLELGEGIKLSDLSFAFSGDDLIVTYGDNSSSKITINGQNKVGGKVEILQFHDGLSASLSGLVIAATGGSASGINGEQAFLVGASGNEMLTGADQDDVIFGGAGVDTIAGGDGDDTIEGGAGADTLDGGTNSLATDTPTWGDTVSYRSSVGAVTVDLRNQDGMATQSGGDAQGDILTGFENYAGSLTAQDIVDGDDNDNRIFGFGGSDILRGNGGNDVLIGGEGNDFLYGDDGEDNISGGAGDDTLQGGSDKDTLDGGDGSDTIFGQDGNDIILGGDGDDTLLRGDGGDDLIDGGAGDDIIDGGTGNDRLIGGVGNDTIDGGAGDDLILLGANSGADSIIDTSGINIIAFDLEVSRDDLWITQVGNDLRIGVIGGDTIATVADFFAATGASLVDRIQTADGQLLLNHSDVQAMVTRMTTESASATPDALPVDIAADLDLYWDGVQGVAPRAPETVQTLDIDNHGANAINLDDWPDLPPSGRGSNLVDDNGWPRDIGNIPTAGTALAGWAAWTFSDTDWVSETDGPYGSDIVTLRAGENDSDTNGGGLISDGVTLNNGKTHEFTWYFKKEGTATQNIYFGPGYGTVADPQLKDAATGSDQPYAKFLTLTAATQEASLENGRWYKVVAYVLPEGADDVAASDLGGVFDTTTGQKVLDVNKNFRWHEGNTTNFDLASQATVQGGGPTFLNTHFYQPEIREVDPVYMVRNGEKLNLLVDSLSFTGVTEGWANYPSLASNGESRWTYVIGADGTEKTVLQAGQFDSHATGGGNLTNDVAIEADKTYRFTQYFKKSDLTKQKLLIGISASGDAGNGLVSLHNGASASTGYFLNATTATQGQYLDDDKWYKLVGYVLDSGASNASIGSWGGIYDAETGLKVQGLDIPAFRWDDNASNSNIEALARFYTNGDTANPGWSTYFDAPTFAAIPNSDLLADNADPFGNDAQSRNVVKTFFVTGVTDHDNNITAYAINPDGLPAKGELTLLDAATGQFSYTPFADSEGEDSFSVVVTDADGNASVVPVNVNLSVPGVNRAPEVPIGGFAVSIDENSNVGDIAGTLLAEDLDGGIDYRFTESLTTMVGGKYVSFTQDNRFRMERDYGKVVLNEGDLDYENGQRDYTYEIRVTDKNSGFNSRTAYSSVNISVSDVNEAHALNDAAIDVNYYSKALGPFVPMPDDQGRAINLRDLMLDDPEGANVSWAITGVTLGGAAVSTHPWSIDNDGSLHLNGAIAANDVYVVTVEASDDALANSAVSATLTLNVGQLDGFVANPVIQEFNFDFPWFDYGYGGILAPVVLDLDGDGVELISFAASNVEFDMDGDGFRDPTGWFGADDGLLVIDLNGDGIVNDGSEISFQRFVDGAFSDLEGLAFFDTNSNGLLDAGDERWDEFGVWRDANSDGITDAGELLTLTDMGIESISLTGTPTGELPNANDNAIFATSEYRRNDGTTGVVGDTFLVFDPQANLPSNNPDPDPGDGGDNNDGDNSGGDSGGDTADTSGLAFSHLNYSRKKKKYRMHAVDGRLVIGPKNRDVNNFNAGAGQINGATILHFRKKSRGILTPLIIDLDGDGVEMRRWKKSHARFDMDGDGSRDNVGWVGKDDGFLVIDRNNNGRIDDGSELSFLTENPDATSDLDALRSLDSNGDGIISADDERFGELKIWRDANDNGFTDAGELKTLAEHGIASINLAGQATSGRAKIGHNLLLATTTFTREDGSTGTVGDVALGFKPAGARSFSGNATRNGIADRFEDNGLTAGFFPRQFAANSRFGFREPIGISQELNDHGFDAFALADLPESARIDAVATLPSRQPVSLERLLDDDTEQSGSKETSTTEAAAPEKTGGSPESEQAASGQEDADARKLTLMVQDMGIFGARSAADILQNRDRGDISPLDYYAA